MARQKEFDDQAVVRAARDVFWECGYVGTSMAQLQTATGLSRSSMYETYGSKRKLFDRAAQNYVDEIMGPRLTAMETPGSGRQDIVEHFTGMAAFLRSHPDGCGSRGCLIVNISTDLVELDRTAVDVVLAFRDRLRAAFARSLESIETVSDPVSIANLLMCGQIGMMITSRSDLEFAATLAENYIQFVSGL